MALEGCAAHLGRIRTVTRSESSKYQKSPRKRQPQLEPCRVAWPLCRLVLTCVAGTLGRAHPSHQGKADQSQHVEVLDGVL